ncbi:hypothetical protein [Helicobacter felis]|uniref:hypothetical protein n=1 Tax=Helicobacter felis TaxID=214 RepID=UPI000CF05C70|nr:hypothetical protein [Helicobacter felis]
MRSLVWICLLCFSWVGLADAKPSKKSDKSFEAWYKSFFPPQAWQDQMQALQLEMIDKDVAYTRLLLDRSVAKEIRQKRLQAFEKQRAQDFYTKAWPLLDIFPIFKDRKLPAHIHKIFKNIVLLLLWEYLEDTRLTNLDYDPDDSVYPDALEPYFFLKDTLLPFFFSPLLASQLDPLAYVQSLPSLEQTCAQGKCAYVKDLTSAMGVFHWLYFIDAYNEFATSPISREVWGLVHSVPLRDNLKSAWYLVQLSKKHNPFLEEILKRDLNTLLEAFKNYALLRGLFYLHNIQFYIQGLFQDYYPVFTQYLSGHGNIKAYKSAHTRILNQPQLCLLPKYLSQKAKRACLVVLKSPPKSVLDSLRTLLKQMRLLSVDDVPCLYLNPQGEIQHFKSKSAICRALSALKLH